MGRIRTAAGAAHVAVLSVFLLAQATRGDVHLGGIFSSSGVTPIEGNAQKSMPTEIGQGDGTVISVNYTGGADVLRVKHAVECCGGLIYLNPLQDVVDDAFRHWEPQMQDSPNDPPLRTLRICPPEDTRAYKAVCRLHKKKAEVRVGRSATFPRMLYPYTNPAVDHDVSGQIQANGAVERDVTRIWYPSLKMCCSDPSKNLVADVGANFGWYSVMSALMGCRVIAWEPVPLFREFFRYGMWLNDVTDKIQIRNRVAADDRSIRVIVVPDNGIWGTAGVDGMNMDNSLISNYTRIQVKGELVSEVVDQDVCVMKVDVEGFEPETFEGAFPLINKRKVEHIFLEYSPGVYEISTRWDQLVKWAKLLRDFHDSGYNLFHIPMAISGIGTTSVAVDQAWSSALRLPRLAMSNITFEYSDFLKLRHRAITRIPEDLSPNGFHARFGFNTNLFLKRDDKVPAGGSRRNAWPSPPWPGADGEEWRPCSRGETGPDGWKYCKVSAPHEADGEAEERRRSRKLRVYGL